MLNRAFTRVKTIQRTFPLKKAILAGYLGQRLEVSERKKRRVLDGSSDFLCAETYLISHCWTVN